MTCDLRTEPVIRVLRHRSDHNATDHDVADRVVVDDSEIVESLVGFRDVLLHAHEIIDLAVPIPAAAAYLLRVLYTLSARVTGLDQAVNQREFEQLRATLAKAGRFDSDAIQDYLDADNQAGRWELFDSAWPWLQDPRLVDQAERKNINAVVATRPGQNSPIWWQHTWDERAPALDPEQALYWLLAQHGYGSGGAGGVRRINGTGDQYMSAGPLRGTISFYPLGRTLFETLLAGIPAPATAINTGEDLAPWEAHELPDPLSQPPGPTWPAGLLLGQSRHAILFISDSAGRCAEHCYFTWAYKKRHAPLADPYTIQVRNALGEMKPRMADANRAIWRDVDALLMDTEGHHRPPVVGNVITLPLGWQDALRFRVHGWDQDRKATDRMMFTATTPPLLPWMVENDPAAAECAGVLHRAAEDMAEALRSALRSAYRSLGTGSPGKSHGKDVPWIPVASRYYWPRAEYLFWRLLGQRTPDNSHREFLAIAQDAVDAATKPTAHHLPVAREVARAHTALRRYASRANTTPNRTDDGQ
jgi:CRISPR system Cascade subunit CasA